MKIILTFITKNESAVIERMMNSVIDMVDECICTDTGSNDGTPEIIKNFFAKHNKPCTVLYYDKDKYGHDMNFSDWRNHALRHIGQRDAVAFWIDSKEELIIKDGDVDNIKKQIEGKDAAYMIIKSGNASYSRQAFFNLNKRWAWQQPIHEIILCKEFIYQKDIVHLMEFDVHVMRRLDGHTWTSQTQEQKYLKHAEVFEKYIAKGKGDERTVYYCAQSFKDAFKYKEALKWYRKRVSIKHGFFEERYYAQLMVGDICEKLGEPVEKCLKEYIKCSEIDSMRAEHFLHIIYLLRNNGRYKESMEYSQMAVTNFHGKNPYPSRSLLIDNDTYSHKLMEAHQANVDMLLILSLPMSRKYHVVVFDGVGTPYTGNSYRNEGLGGSEFETILLVEALAEKGYDVAVINRRTEVMCKENGVEYHPFASLEFNRFQCKTALIIRNSPIPSTITFDSIRFWFTDIPNQEQISQLNDWIGHGAIGKGVCVSNWHRSLFPSDYKMDAIYNMIPDWVYDMEPKAKDNNKHIYSSSALKGLDPTVALWREFKEEGFFDKAQLNVCHPGYDNVDPERLKANNINLLGSLSFPDLVEELRTTGNMFYVNAFAETFCIAAVLAEVLGVTPHILTVGEVGALKEVMSNPDFVSINNVGEFRKRIQDGIAKPHVLNKTKDYRVSTILPQWIQQLNLTEENKTEITNIKTEQPMETINEIYEKLCVTPSDINFHLPKLKEYTEQCDTVYEFGVRWVCSTYAFLAGRPKKLISVDLNYHPNIEKAKMLAKQENIDFEFIKGNIMYVPIQQADLIFIDTFHNFRQITLELDTFSDRAKKFIIMHDIFSFGYKDEFPDGSPVEGLMPAINNFLSKHPEWVIDYQTNENNGLMCLKRI